jgi:hypothetical protein
MRAYSWLLLPCIALVSVMGCAEGEDSEGTAGTGGPQPPVGGTGATGGSGGSGEGGTGATAGSGGSGATAGSGGAATGGTGGSAGEAGTGGAAGEAGTGGAAGSSGTGGATGGTGGATGGTGGATGGTGGATGGTGGATGGTGGATGGTGGATGGTGGTGTTYAHTITIDGVNDFELDETFDTTTTSFKGYVAWDANNLYVGLSGSDVGGASPTKFFVVYLGGVGGTTTGVAYQNQTPGLPFEAMWQVHWKANNTNTRAVKWSGSAWVPETWNFTGKVVQNGSFVEMAIPLVNIGSPSTLAVHLAMVNEQSGGEWTFAGVPFTSFTDGFDRNYTKYYDFDLTGSIAPTQYSILP